ncbi:putative cyclin-D7-1 [Rhododendron vialii]|uniref:putative cyclin-D7-1 n=1 Tax=Rhododendron vialii TaxID=182163 RepID=UPI00265F43B3|nr:putative cyclin-D7-1 [Rhododendron vialii]
MDSLLCDEVWLTENSKSDSRHNVNGCFYTTKEDCREAFEICLQKELSYMPESGYRDHLQSSGLSLARFRAMLWLAKSQSRLNLSCQSVFNAANYFDRFLSSKQCKGWKYWMFELLAIACLSVASKFGETAHPFHEIQMEDLDHSFQSNLIQWMELTLLKTLGWRLGSVTAYSYIELLMSNFIDTLSSFLLGELTTRVNELLLGALSDSELVEFRPCTIAISAVKCVIKELELPSTANSHLAYINSLIPGDQKDDIIKCHKILEGKLAYPLLLHNSMDRRRYCICPPSPVTVLKREQVEACGCQGDHLSLFKMPNLKSSNMIKWKREVDHDQCDEIGTEL